MQFVVEHNVSILVFSVVCLIVLESFFPLREQKGRRKERWTVNLILSTFTYATVLLVVRPSGLYAAMLSQSYAIGLFKWVELTHALEILFSFLLLDLSFYYWHRLNHSTNFLWRFHNTHHYDPDMDVTTAFRFHFGEIFFSGGFRFIQILLLGVDPVILIAYDFLFQLGVYFHHSNLRLPYRFEKYSQYFFVSPRVHSVHHTQSKEKTDSNYSVLFSLWDLVHGTFNKVEERPKPVGVPGYLEKEDNLFFDVVKSPFKKQKKYW